MLIRIDDKDGRGCKGGYEWGLDSHPVEETTRPKAVEVSSKDTP